MLKFLFTTIFGCWFVFCSAQKQKLSYSDLQYIVQNKTEQITIFLKDKNFQLVPSSNSGELHFLTLIADEDYTDIAISFEKRHTRIHLTTADEPQVAIIQQALQNYTRKNSKGSTVYRVKDEAFATISIKEEEPRANNFKVYSINLEN